MVTKIKQQIHIMSLVRTRISVIISKELVCGQPEWTAPCVWSWVCSLYNTVYDSLDIRPTQGSYSPKSQVRMVGIIHVSS